MFSVKLIPATNFFNTFALLAFTFNKEMHFLFQTFITLNTNYGKWEAVF